MTATEPQTAEPKSKRLWHHRASVWLELVLGVLALAGFLWFCVEHRSLFNNYEGRCELAELAGLIAVPFAFQHRPVQPLPPWCFPGILGVFTLALATTTRGPSSSMFLVVFFVFAGVFFAGAVWDFFKARQQFTIRTLMLVTLGVAILCSVSFYVPIVPLLFFLTIPTAAYAMPRRGPTALCRGKDGPNNLKSEISDPKPEISDPKPAIQNPKSKI